MDLQILKAEALLSAIMAVIWLVIIALLHVIKPQLKPSTHMISEYANKPKGWIMQLAFFCMALSCFSLVLATWSYVSHGSLILLIIDAIGFAGAGLFVTDPRFITKGSETRSGILHNVFSFIVIPLFPITATLVGISMGRLDMWTSVHAWLPVLFVMTWLGFIGFMGSAIYSAKHKAIPVGYFQRFMVLTYAVWLIVVAFVMV